MLSRLMSMNPAGIVLLLLGVAVMLAGKIIPERVKIAGKLADRRRMARRADALHRGMGAELFQNSRQ